MVDPKHYYDDFSGTYERERGRGYHALIDDIEASIVTENLVGERILEVGCGTGLILERLASVTPSAFGADLSRGMLAAARRRKLEVTQADATRLPYRDGAFDLVCSFKVLAHVPDIRAAMAELGRVTRPGGTIVAELYNPLSLRYLAKRVVGPRRTGPTVDEADVSTRWDLPWKVATYLPPGVDLVRLRGVRVVTPAAAFLRAPILGGLLERAERRLSRVDAAAPFGGFVVAVARKC